jgi:alpha-galactosidase
MNKSVLILSLLFISGVATAIDTIKPDKESVTVRNEYVSRTISIKNGRISTIDYNLSGDKFNFASNGYEEFSFLLNGTKVNGRSGWRILKTEETNGENQGKGAIITATGTSDINKDIEIRITYMLYPGLPVVRKMIDVVNKRNADVKIEAFNVEDMNPIKSPEMPVHDQWYMTQNGRKISYDGVDGAWNDAVVVLFNLRAGKGIVLGNEADGVLKRTSACKDDRTITIGLSRPEDPYPFRKWLKKDESWDSPWAFTILFVDALDTYSVMNTTLPDFVRKHMGIRVAKNKSLPTFIYNSWMPWEDKINEELIINQIDLAAACGAEVFTIDCGWYTTKYAKEDEGYESVTGDYIVNSRKFPRGIKYITDYIISKGMRPGIWISVASAGLSSEVYQKHPEWFMTDSEGKHYFVQGIARPSRTASLATGWYDYILKKMSDIITENNISYVKLDFGVVTGAYNTNPLNSGDYTPREAYRDRPESMLVLYRRMWDLFNELHQRYPDLFIDCTYETMGKRQSIDYAMCKHADGNWLSNFNEFNPTGSLRVRHLAYYSTPAIPAATMVIGNQQLQDSLWELSLQSVIGAIPIMLGDISKMPKDQRERCKQWSKWLRATYNKYDFLLYRQDLRGFGEPANGSWDGYQRINTDTKTGGIVGVFRHGAPYNKRTVVVNFLDAKSVYQIKSAPDGKVIATMSGADLGSKGFEVTLNKEYEGAIYEISIKNNTIAIKK